MIECGICLRQLSCEITSSLDCNHAFCIQCIAIWASSNNSNASACPNCRVPYLVSRCRSESVVSIQSVLRTNVVRKTYLSKKNAVITIQKWYRMFIVKKKYEKTLYKNVTRRLKLLRIQRRNIISMIFRNFVESVKWIKAKNSAFATIERYGGGTNLTRKSRMRRRLNEEWMIRDILKFSRKCKIERQKFIERLRDKIKKDKEWMHQKKLSLSFIRHIERRKDNNSNSNTRLFNREEAYIQYNEYNEYIEKEYIEKEYIEYYNQFMDYIENDKPSKPILNIPNLWRFYSKKNQFSKTWHKKPSKLF